MYKRTESDRPTTVTGEVTRQVVQFEVIEMFKGDAARAITVEFSEGGTSCDLEELDFRIGDVYLISAGELMTRRAAVRAIRPPRFPQAATSTTIAA